MADYAGGTIDFHILLFCASRQPLFSAMSRTFFSALRLVAVAIVLAATGGVCVDILPASAQQNEITTLDRQIEQLRKEGRYSEAVPLAQRVLAIEEKALGPDHPDVAASLNSLGLLYKQQGRYADAEPLYKRSLAIREKALGPDHPDVALSLNNLAALYYNQGRYAEAKPLYKRSLAIREKALGPDHPNVAA
jgi:tetratricopeptide (TPR) repeat protein